MVAKACIKISYWFDKPKKDFSVFWCILLFLSECTFSCIDEFFVMSSEWWNVYTAWNTTKVSLEMHLR